MFMLIATSVKKVRHEFHIRSARMRPKRIIRKQFHFFQAFLVFLYVLCLPLSVLLLAFSGYTLLYHGEPFIIQHVNVLGHHFTDRQTIINAAGIHYDQSIFAASIDDMRSAIEKDPYIGSVLVRRELPATIAIEVQEQKPMAVISFNKQYFLISEQGVLLEKVSSIKNLNFPIIVTKQPDVVQVGETILNKHFQEALIIMMKMKEETPECYSRLVTIQVHNSYHVSMRMRNLSGTIYVSTDNINSNLIRLKQLLPKLMGTSFASVDFRFRQKAIVKFIS